jgi:putative ABC transport system permease protein
MTVSAQKAFRDAWQERTRSVLVIFTITIGVAALLAFLGSYAILTRELDRGYLATNPASAILHTDSVDEHMLASALADPEVGIAQARRTVFGRIKVGPGQWRNLALFVIPNFGDIRLNKFVPEEGAWPPATGEVLIERDAFQVARTRIGELISFRVAGGQSHTLRVSGRVHDVGQAQARMENSVYGYITTDTLAGILEKPSLDLLLIQVAHDRYNQDHIRQVAIGVKHRLEAEGHPVNDIDFPVPGKHPHADLMAGLLLAISSFGFFLLVLSGILALNFIAALMAGQVRQIGVMKALGGTRLQLARIYLLQSLLLGGAATALALPLGIWGSHLLCAYMSSFLNFDIVSFYLPAWVFLLAAAAGIAVPLLACAVPLWRALAIPVREALASSGTASENFGVGSVDRLLAGVGGATRPVLLAMRNSFRRRVRLALTCATLICAAMFFMAALNLRTSMIDTFDRLFAAEKFDLTLDLEQMYPTDKIERALHGIPGVITWEDWIVVDGWVPPEDSTELQSRNSGVPAGPQPQTDDERGNHFIVVAMPSDSKLFAPVVARGRSLQAGDTDSILLNPTMAAQNPQIKVGDEVRLRIESTISKWRVAGICREPMLPPPIVYVPISALAAMHPGIANTVQIELKDSKKNSLELTREHIDPSLEREGIRVAGGRSKAEFRTAVDEHVLMIYVFLVLASCIVGGVGGLGLMTSMGLNVVERRREIGILRAIGATPKTISAVVMGEAVTVAVISWGAAVLLAIPLGKALATMLGHLLHSGFDSRIAPLGIVISLGASGILAILASVAAARSATRLTVREALTYEQMLEVLSL